MTFDLTILFMLTFVVMTFVFRLNPIALIVELVMYVKTVIYRILFTLPTFERRSEKRDHESEYV